MTLDAVKDTLRRYMESDRHDERPRVVNANDVSTLCELCKFLKTRLGASNVINARDYAKSDFLSEASDVQRALHSCKGARAVLGLSSSYALRSQDAARRMLATIANGWTFQNCRVIVVCYKCRWWIEGDSDKRNRQFVYNIDSIGGKESKYPEVIFVPSMGNVDKGGKTVIGVEALADAIESMDGGTLFVVTRRRKADYPNSIIPIRDGNSAYNVLCRIDSRTQALKEDLFDDAVWSKMLHALRALQEKESGASWVDYVKSVFDTTDAIEIARKWDDMDKDDRRLFFAALRLHLTEPCWAIDYAAQESTHPDDIRALSCRAILQKEHTDKDYWARYEEHKRITKAFDVSTDVSVKGDDALYYMTANNMDEKKKVITFLCEHTDAWQDAKKLKEVLSHVYSDLADYLDEYIITTGDGQWSDYATRYFNEYKWAKLFNRVEDAFLKKVDNEAKERKYNRYIETRSAVISTLDMSNAKTLFIDALGVEYLAFIKRWCEHNGLDMTAKVCRCELPSITSVNKPLLTFDNGGGDPELDKVKHSVGGGFDYTKNQLPVHLSKELEIIAGDLSRVKKVLDKGDIDKVYIVSDHGASRLAVIHEGEKHEMSIKGEHSGRCCPVGDTDKKPDCAIEENSWYVLCNYDRFSGSRKAQVETHGGATLEEVAVPVITITAMTGDAKPINVRLAANDTLMVGKSGVTLSLWSNTKLLNANVRVAGTFYAADSSTATGDAKNGWVYKVQLSDIKKSGKYSADVIVNGGVAATVQFTTHTKGMGSSDDMGL